MIIDGHCHLDPELPPAGILETMDRGGIDRAVLIAAAQEPMGPVPRAGAAFFSACMSVPPLRMPLYRVARRSRRLVAIPKPDNEPVFAAARASERFLPFAFLNPLIDAHDELDRADAARGVKLHPWLHGYRLTDALPVLARCEDKNLPVLAHLGFGPPEDVEAVLDALPGLTLILAHAGIPHFERLWRLPRLFFDVAAPQLVSRLMIRRLLAAVGPARVVYGSDAPIGIRRGKAFAYDPPPLPDRAMGDTLASLLP